MGQCPNHKKAGHRSLKEAAHVLSSFDRAHTFENFTRGTAGASAVE